MDRRSVRRIRSLVLIFLFLLLIGSMFLHLYIRNYITASYRRMEELQRQQALINAQNQALKVEIESLMRPDRIKSIAASHIGMVFPEPETLVVIINPGVTQEKP